MNSTTLVAAYGRSYRTSAAAIADFEAGKDFLIADVSNRWNGKPVNRDQLREAGYIQVVIRYLDSRRLVAVPVPSLGGLSGNT
jgi:hypothetical protein